MPTDLRSRIASSLSGAYTIERELGGGGMSRVFLAADERLGRRIVVKVVAPDVLEGASLDRFAQEIRLAARLQHPNVVPVLAAGDADGVPYYTMPFVAGQSLRARLDAGPPIALAEAARLLGDVLRALAYAHAEGVVHRDVKPDNVLLSGGAAVVADFGIAKALHTALGGAPGPGAAGAPGTALTRVGTALGTPAYMAPEQAVGEAVDGRADLYAWGVVAYEVLAGAHPFAGRAGTQQLLVAHLTERPAPLAERAPHLPPALAALVEQCLEKAPDARPATAADALERLDVVAFSGERPAAQRPAGGHPGRARPGRRARTLAAAGAAGLVALGGGGAVAWRARTAAAPPLVAVLPVQTQGAADDPLFADGLGEAVTQKLAALGGLRVIDPGSVASAADEATRAGRARPTPQAVGRALGADYVLRAVARWGAAGGAGADRQVRIVPTLVRVADGTTRWAGEPLAVGAGGDLFRAQTELATQVARALGVALGAGDRARLARALTTDSLAYAAYLRGQALAERGVLEHSAPVIEAALAEFARATARDPAFAEAYARSGALLGVIYNAGGRPGVLLDSAERFARRALALDPTNATALGQTAFVLTQRGAADSAWQVMQRAVAANPSHVELRRAYAEAARVVGDTAALHATAEQLVRLAPRSAAALEAAAAARAWLRRPAGAADSLYERALAAEPGRLSPYLGLARLAAARGDTAAVDRWVGAFRTQGGRVGPSTVGLLRHGGDALRREVAAATPASLGAATPSDRDDVYQARLQALAAAGEDVRALAEASAALVGAQLREPGLPATARYYLLRHAARLAAVRGDATAARRDLALAAADPLVRAYPSGAAAAQHHCMAAEAQAWLGDGPGLAASLRRCLAAPGGYTAAQARGLPAIARLAGRAEVAAVLAGAAR